MPAPYAVESVANTILALCERRRIPIDPLKLQKLMYYACGYFLAETQTPLIDENFEAWSYGPVLPSIYRQFRRFGSKNIPHGERARNVCEYFTDLSDGGKGNVEVIPDEKHQEYEIINYVIDEYGKYTGVYLSDLTHKIGTPWDTAQRAAGGIRNTPISNDAIRQYFAELVD